MKMRLFLLLIGLLLLVACGGSSDVATAVDYLNALEMGDLDNAANYVCPARQDTLESAIVTLNEANSFSYENVSCSQRGTDVACRFTVVQDTVTDDTPQQFDRQVVFEMEDGLICGFEEEVAQ
ncbi:MAG: hypothetical protein KC425_14725 [Anaerolineales bacterium]|nr:hypothetical protein [Anaerolineales bacterium]